MFGRHFFFLFQECKDPFGGSRHGLYLIQNLCNLLHRLGEVLDILNECLNITDGNCSPNGEQSAREGNGCIAQVSDKHHDWLHQAGEELRFPSGMVKGIIGFRELLNGVLFLVVCLNDGVTGIGFFYLPVDVSQVFLLLLKVFLGLLDHERNHCNRNRQNDNCNQRHQRRDSQHHDQNADHRCNRCDNLGNALVQALSEGVDIVGNAGEHFAIGTAFKVCHRHPVDFFGDVFSHPVADFLRDTAHNPALYKVEQRAEQV